MNPGYLPYTPDIYHIPRIFTMNPGYLPYAPDIYHIPRIFTHIPRIFTHIPWIFTHIPRIRYAMAAHCLEELILSNPHHYVYHLKYAEVFNIRGTGGYLISGVLGGI